MSMTDIVDVAVDSPQVDSLWGKLCKIRSGNGYGDRMGREKVVEVLLFVTLKRKPAVQRTIRFHNPSPRITIANACMSFP